MIPEWFWYTNALLFGSIIGSFINVCIYRLPRGESIVFPPSRCPACKEKILPRDNIPVISYLLLWGGCRSCGARISPLYPLVEMICALLFAVYLARFGLSWILIPYLLLASAMVAVFFIDLEHQIIPDSITIPGMAAGLAFSALLPHSLVEGLTGLFAGGLFFFLAAAASHVLLKKEGMGGGDIKMAAMMGAFLGWKVLMVAIFISLMTGSAVAVILLATGKRGRKDAIPFGPFLALGTIAASLWGIEIFDWYLISTIY